MLLLPVHARIQRDARRLCVVALLLTHGVRLFAPDAKAPQRDTPARLAPAVPRAVTAPAETAVNEEVIAALRVPVSERADDLAAETLLQELTRARTRPRAAVEALIAVDHPATHAWAGFLLLATSPEDPRTAARAEALALGARFQRSRSGSTSPPPGELDLVAALEEAAIASAPLHVNDEIPCWIANRWPAAWSDADLDLGSPRDALATCAPALTDELIERHARAAHDMLGLDEQLCGTERHDDLRTAAITVFDAWNRPRAVLAMARDPERDLRSALDDAHRELLVTLDHDLVAHARFLHATDPSPAWRRKLQQRLRQRGLTRTEADTVIAATLTSVEATLLNSELNCVPAQTTRVVEP